MKRIVMDCLNRKCDTVFLMKYEGERENDIEVFCEEIATYLSCPECKENNFIVGFR